VCVVKGQVPDSEGRVLHFRSWRTTPQWCAMCWKARQEAQVDFWKMNELYIESPAAHCNALQRTATHCNALQRTAAHCTALHRAATHCPALQRTANNATQKSFFEFWFYCLRNEITSRPHQRGDLFWTLSKTLIDRQFPLKRSGEHVYGRAAERLSV